MTEAVSLQSLATIIKRHKLEPVNGEYQITKEMVAEAAAIDEASGVHPPSPEKMKAFIEGREPGWEEVSARPTTATIRSG